MATNSRTSKLPISDDDILESFCRMINERPDVIDVFQDIQYQGFDPKFCRDNVMKKIQAKIVSLSDIYKALAIYIVRGTQVGKIRAKTSDAGLKILADVTKKLELKFVKATELKPTDVTLSRLSAAFPELVAFVIKSRPSIAKTFSLIIPPYICFPGGGALIPTEEVALRNAWIDWSMHFNKLINPSARERDPTEEEKNFWRITLDSSIFTNEKRRSILVKLSKSDKIGPFQSSAEASEEEEEEEEETLVDSYVAPWNGFTNITNSAFETVKLNAFNFVDDNNAKQIREKIDHRIKEFEGKAIVLDNLPAHVYAYVRIMHGIIMELNCDYFCLDKRTKLIFFVKGKEFLTYPSGQCVAIDSNRAELVGLPLSDSEILSLTAYRIVKTGDKFVVKKGVVKTELLK